MFEERSKAAWALYAAVLLTFMGYAGNYILLEPLHSQFFPFAAWAYVLFADNLTYRLRGSSLAVSRTGEFFYLALWSAAICALLELLNVRLGAWQYLDQPATLSTRWAGRAFSWAAILPSIFITAEMPPVSLIRGLKFRPLPAGTAVIVGSGAAGLAGLALALALPGRLWPLAAAGLFLLAEPLTFRLGLGSLLREWQGGLPGKTLRLAVSGIICGLLWNCWNNASGASLACPAPSAGPFLLGLPLSAYAGFAFSGLLAYSLYSLATGLRAGKTWEEPAWPMPGRPLSLPLRSGILILLVIACYAALRAVDAYSVKLYLGWI
jgi:hypothetical protein